MVCNEYDLISGGQEKMKILIIGAEDRYARHMPEDIPVTRTIEKIFLPRGASDEEIMKDYLKTNIARKEVNQEIINSLKEKLTEDQIEGLQIALTVDKNYLFHAREIMNENFGSFEGYLSEGLSLEKDYIEHFQSIYLNYKL